MKFDSESHKETSNVLSKFCGSDGTIDVLINNAGVFTPGFLARTPLTAIQHQFSVNAVSPIVFTQAAIPFLRRSEAPVVLNVSSVAATTPTLGQCVYSSTKAALEIFTKGASAELARYGITIAGVRLAPVETDMWHSLQLKTRKKIEDGLFNPSPMCPNFVATKILNIVDNLDISQSGSIIEIGNGYEHK